MRTSKKFISYLLFFIFGFLSVKSAFNLNEKDHSDCQEFAHVHHYKLVSQNPYKSDVSLYKKIATNQDDDNNCHESKSVDFYSVSPSIVFVITKPDYSLTFKPVFILENHFKSPYLEPNRKPPKAA